MTISKNGNIKLGPVGTLIVTTIITMLSFMCWKTIDIGERVSKLEGVERQHGSTQQELWTMSYTGIELDMRFAVAITQDSEETAYWPAWLYRAIFDFDMYGTIPIGHRVVCGVAQYRDYQSEPEATLNAASKAGFEVPPEVAESGIVDAMNWVVAQWEAQQT